MVEEVVAVACTLHRYQIWLTMSWITILTSSAVKRMPTSQLLLMRTYSLAMSLPFGTSPIHLPRGSSTIFLINQQGCIQGTLTSAVKIARQSGQHTLTSFQFRWQRQQPSSS